MVNQKSETNNILLSGYLREHQKEHKNVQVPNLVTSIIGDYWRQYQIHRLGDDQNKNTSKFEEIIISQTYSNHKSKVFTTNCTIANSTTYNINTAKWIQAVANHPDELASSKLNISEIEDNIIDIQCGLHHILFLTSTGKCYAYGSNDSGQCGFDKSISQLQSITLIPFNKKIISIACGELHSLFINEDNALLGCGSNYCGQLGVQSEIQKNDNEIDESDTEIDESDTDSDFDSDDEWVTQTELYFIFKPEINAYFEENGIKIKRISCGAHHSLCITTLGDVYTFGHNGFYNLGNGKCTEYGMGESMPCKLEFNNNQKIVDGSCGNNHNVLITDQNEIIVFGNNQENQCSGYNNCDEIKKPYILSKEKEFSKKYCFVEKVVCIGDTTLILYW